MSGRRWLRERLCGEPHVVSAHTLRIVARGVETDGQDDQPLLRALIILMIILSTAGGGLRRGVSERGVGLLFR